MSSTPQVLKVFKECVQAIRDGKLISRLSEKDKEFHFQDWVEARLAETGLNYEQGGRNKYPDFRLVEFTEGYEIKGLAYPGRLTTFDSNSQVPSGIHNKRTIFYIFGRYPKKPDGLTYPVLDLVVCHGSFLNADHEYVHQNKSIKGFGSYGDIMIRDRKMYVVPTPFALVAGVAHKQTLILPEGYPVTNEFYRVSTLIRKEADSLIVGYSFDLSSNTIQAKTIPNPSAGREHVFHAWRLEPAKDDSVKMKDSFEISDESVELLEENILEENDSSQSVFF